MGALILTVALLGGCNGGACGEGPVRKVIQAQPVRKVIQAQPVRKVAQIRPVRRLLGCK